MDLYPKTFSRKKGEKKFYKPVQLLLLDAEAKTNPNLMSSRIYDYMLFTRTLGFKAPTGAFKLVKYPEPGVSALVFQRHHTQAIRGDKKNKKKTIDRQKSYH